MCTGNPESGLKEVCGHYTRGIPYHFSCHFGEGERERGMHKLTSISLLPIRWQCSKKSIGKCGGSVFLLPTDIRLFWCKARQASGEDGWYRGCSQWRMASEFPARWIRRLPSSQMRTSVVRFRAGWEEEREQKEKSDFAPNRSSNTNNVSSGRLENELIQRCHAMTMHSPLDPQHSS